MPTGPVLVQSAAGTGTAGTSYALSLPSPVTVGNTLVILAVCQRGILPDTGGGNSPSSVVSTLGNTVSATNASPNIDWNATPLKSYTVASSLAGMETITVNVGTTSIISIAVWEFTPFTFNFFPFPTGTSADAGVTATQLFDLTINADIGAGGSLVCALAYGDGISGFNSVITTIDGTLTNNPNIAQTSVTTGAGDWESFDISWGHAFVTAPGSPTVVKPTIAGVDHNYGLNISISAATYLGLGNGTNYTYTVASGTADLYAGEQVNVQGMTNPSNNGVRIVDSFPSTGVFHVTDAGATHSSESGYITPGTDFSREWVHAVAINLLTYAPPPPPPSWTISGNISGPGGPGAAVALTGDAIDNTTADGSGNYSFTSLADGSYTVTVTNAGFEFGPV